MTFEELKALGYVEHHRCDACKALVGYLVHPEMAAAVFDSGCECGGPSPNYRVLTHQELAQIPPPVAPVPALEPPLAPPVPDSHEYEWNARYDAAWPIACGGDDDAPVVKQGPVCNGEGC